MYAIRSLIYRLTAPIRFLGRWTVGLSGAPRRLLGLSLPARVASLLAVFLVLLAIAAYVGFFLSNDRTHWYEWTRFRRMGVIALLLAATPLAVYKTLSLWLEGEVSRFPEIDRAWQEGLEALKANGVDLCETPIFLVLGAPDEQLADGIMDATAFKFIFAGIPAGRGPLRWYVDEQAVYLFVSQLGCLSRLNYLATTSAAGAGADIRGTLVAQGDGAIRGTVVASSPSIRDSGPPVDTDEIRGTQVAAQSDGITNTIRPNEIRSTLVAGAAAPVAATKSGGGGRSLTRKEIDEESERLAYVCDRLRRVRQPLCPLNGVLTLLPLATLDDLMAARGLADAIQQDLGTVRRGTMLHFPVVALVTGMEQELGFAELVRRVGAKRASESRFGKGLAVWQRPTGENLDALSSHVVGAFEDWVYTLFREADALNKPGNGKLFAMLCKIRSYLGQRIRQTLLDGFSEDGISAELQRGHLFGGLYLAATGATSERQAFVRSVVQRLIQEEEELEWTEEATRQDQRFRLVSDFVMIFNGILVFAVVGAVIYTLWAR